MYFIFVASTSAYTHFSVETVTFFFKVEKEKFILASGLRNLLYLTLSIRLSAAILQLAVFSSIFTNMTDAADVSW